MAHAAASNPEAIVFAKQKINTNFIEMISMVEGTENGLVPVKWQELR
jgi:hypothetical protein